MKQFIYQDPHRPRFKSRPINESDAKARKILEGGGWRIVETIDDGVDAAPASEAVSVETAAAPAEPKKGKGKQAAAPAEPKD